MLENTEKTAEKPVENNTPQPAQNADSQGFVDSDNGGIEDFRKVLNIPVEKPADKPDAKTFDNADPFGEMLSGGGEELDELFDPEGEGVNELFEDSEALSEMCVELLDLGMNYASQAISMDWGQDEKYSIPDSRKRKLRKPLATQGVTRVGLHGIRSGPVQPSTHQSIRSPSREVEGPEDGFRGQAHVHPKGTRSANLTHDATAACGDS